MLYKRLTSIICFIVLLFNTTFSYASIQLKVKLEESSSYVTLIELNNNDTDINFEILIPIGTVGNYSISLPAGLEKNGINSTNTCDTTKIISHTNTNFSFTADGQTPFCKYILNYKVGINTIAGTYPISVLNLSTGSAEQQITIKVNNSNTITKAETIDSNSNGYIDRYKLTFSTGGLTNFSNNNLKVGTLTPTLNSIDNNIAYINFTDGIYLSGEKPQITDGDGGVFSGIGVITENSIIEEDKSSPIILEVNSTNIVGQTNPSINIFENAKLVIKFSEKLYSSSVLNSFKLYQNGINITDSSYIDFNESNGDTMYYCIGGYDTDGNCNTPFDINKTYNIDLGNALTDLNSNLYSGGNINVNINVTDITPPISSSITYNGETNNGIIINGNSGNNNYTNSSVGNLNLSIKASDNSSSVDKMCISQDPSLTNDNICDTNWKTYSISSNFTLTGGEGLKKLYIKFKDAAGNISGVNNDSIVWDKTPGISSSNPNGGFFVNGTQNITLNCSDSISGCSKIFYTTNGTMPTTSSSFVNPGNSISISGNNQSINLKFFSTDLAGNIESTTNTKTFTFSNSYVTFDPINSITNQNNITISGTCNNAAGSSNVEYSLNGTSYIDAMNNDCDINNTWSTNISLNNNTTNSIDVRLKNNTSVKSNISIIHDNTSPNNLNLIINNGDSYTNSTNVNLGISANDSNGTDKICISLSSITNDDNCDNSWQSYSNSKTFTLSNGEGNKTIYIKFKDFAGNISSVINDSIILETSIPSVTNNLISGNYTSSKIVTLTSSNTIYYTTNGTTPTNASTLYTGPLTFGATSGTVVLKTIAYSNSGISGNVNTYTYVFGCNPATISNGNILSYPNCTITCHSGYTFNGTSCISNTPPSSSGGGGSGGGGANINDYENYKYISKTKINFEEKITNKTFEKYGILDISGLPDKQLTGNNGIIKIRSALKGLSNLIINENTSIQGDSKLIYAPYSLELKRDLKLDDLKVNNVLIKTFNIKKLFFAGNQDSKVEFNKDITLELNLGGKIDGKVYVYHSNTIDGDFKQIGDGLETNDEGTISLKSSNLGYFIIIRDIYLNRYFSTGNISSSSKIDTNTETKKIIEELKQSIKNESIIELLNKYSNTLISSDFDYYLSFDSELKNKYANIVKGFSEYIINLDNFTTTKDSKYQILAQNAYEEYIKINDFKNFEEKYITKTTRDGIEIYKTNFEPIVKVADALESSMLTKLNKLLETGTISQEKFNQTINDYNEFILHLSIYREYKIKDAAYKALTPGRKFLKVYKMNILPKD